MIRCIIAGVATQCVAGKMIILVSPVGRCEDEKVDEKRSGGWVTVQPLLFNDVERGKVFEIPAGEPCLPVESVDEARRLGLLSGDQELWAAKTNLQRGYTLVFIRGKLRGLMPHHLKQC